MLKDERVIPHELTSSVQDGHLRQEVSSNATIEELSLKLSSLNITLVELVDQPNPVTKLAVIALDPARQNDEGYIREISREVVIQAHLCRPAQQPHVVEQEIDKRARPDDLMDSNLFEPDPNNPFIGR